MRRHTASDWPYTWLGRHSSGSDQGGIVLMTELDKMPALKLGA
jgi:hypothetical protein